MGKRKKSSRKPTGPRKREPLATTFTCLFCHHDNSVNIRVDRKEGVALLVCKVCDQRYQSKVNHLTEAIDIYSEWIDAADAAQNEPPPRRPTASSSRAAPRAAAPASDDDQRECTFYVIGEDSLRSATLVSTDIGTAPN